MNPGLPQGFVRFDSVHYWVLRAIYEMGGSRCFREVLDHFDEVPMLNQFNISQSLIRLNRFGLVFLTRQKNEPHPTYYYSLQPPKCGPRRDHPIPGYVKMRRRRARMKVLTANSSVFNFAKAMSNEQIT